MMNRDLTWQDIGLIVHIADSELQRTPVTELQRIGEKGYYSRMLEKYEETISKS